MKTILCIGAGYVGGPTMAVIAKHCPEHRIVVADVNEERIQAWKSGPLPIYEPGLDAVIQETRDRNLFFTTDICGNIEAADIIFVSVNTPTKTFGHGAGRAADLQYWEKTARLIRDNSSSDKIVVEKSTLPVKTAEAMHCILESRNDDCHFEVVSNPEFLAEGTAIHDLEEPDRVLIGGGDTERGRAAVRELVALYEHWVPSERIVTTNVWSSELSKLASNAFLAQRVSSINSLSAVCEATDADVDEVARALGMDHRIGSKFLNAGIGFGGSCFKKDILNLVYLCEYYGLQEVARYWEGVIQMNEYQKQRFVGRMMRTMFNTLADKTIAVFGFAFKAQTSDTRDSPAITVCRELLEEKARVVVTDPQALDNAKSALSEVDPENITFEQDPYAAAEGAHAIAVLTPWPEFQELDYEKIYRAMQKPAFIFDGRNVLDQNQLYRIGFNVYPVGKQPLSHV